MSDGKISSESGEKYTNFPRWFEANGRKYEIDSITPSGRLRYKGPGVTYEVDPALDFQEIIQEGIENGIFAGSGSTKANPDGVVLRCETIFELWRNLSDDITVEYVDSGIPRLEAAVDMLCGEEAYYRKAVQWFIGRGKRTVENLYNRRDIEGPLTWLELGYWLFVVLGASPRVKFSEITKKNGYIDPDVGLSVLTNNVNGQEQMDLRFSAYKQTKWMKTYLNDIREGSRYIPFPAYYGFVNIRAFGILPATTPRTVVVDGKNELQDRYVDISSANWCLKEVSREDLEMNLSAIRELLQ